MCLCAAKVNSKRLKWKEDENGEQYIDAWKVMRKSNGRLESIVYWRQSGSIISSGEYISDRESKKLNTEERRKSIVEHGIYVFLSRSYARSWSKNYESTFRVKCYRKDFIASNIDAQEAVFMKVTITSRTWSNLFGKQ